MTPQTLYVALQERLGRDPTAPLLTDLDLGSGERVELSVATATNGVAKAAHLVAELSAEVGAPPTIELRVPLHWQVATFALGAWAAGARIVVGPDTSSADPIDAVVLGPAGLDAEASALPDVVWVSRLHPFGLPFAVPPPYPFEDLTDVLRRQPDLVPADLGNLTAPALNAQGIEVTQSDLVRRADELGALMNPASRLLTALSWSTVDGWVAALALPLLGDRSVLLVRGADSPGVDLSRVCATEGIAATAGVDVPGVIRIC